MHEVLNTGSFNTASEKAYKIISEKILSGEFKPGHKLSRRKMAELTEVSVIPVIEALNRLEEDGLVESKPKWGSFVTVPTPEKVRDMYCLREAIECQIARILAVKMTKEQAGELYEIASVLDLTEFTAETGKELNMHHIKFHSRMAEFTGIQSLIKAINKINLFWVLCKAVSSRRARSPLPAGWHKLLVDTILSGDQDKAEDIMRIHVNDSLMSVLEDIEGRYK